MRPDFPFRPASFPFFYGWVIVFASTLGVVMSVPGQTVGVSFFTDHVLAATGLSRIEFSNAYLLGTLVSGLALPYTGVLVDRLGVRRVVLAASLGLAATLVYLANCDRIADFAAGLTGIRREPAAFVVLSVGFLLLRFAGQGTLTLVSRTMVGRWFDRRRGLVAALSQPFVNFGFSSAPLVFQSWILASGWRGAWLQAALIIGPGMGFLGWLLYRDTPEECGLEMDGRAPREPGQEGNQAPAAPAERSFTRGEALRTAVFWLVTLGVANHAMVGTGITFHIADIGAEAGLSARTAAALFLPIAFVSVAVGFGVGGLVRRVAVRHLVMGMMVGQIGAFVGIAHLGETWGWWCAVAGWGLAAGFFGPLTVAVLPMLFGRPHLGAIQGAQMMCFVVASAVGPALLAWFKQALGSYEAVLLGSCAIPILVFVTAPFTREHPSE